MIQNLPTPDQRDRLYLAMAYAIATIRGERTDREGFSFKALNMAFTLSQRAYRRAYDNC